MIEDGWALATCSRCFISSVFGFSALCAEKPNTNKKTPRFPSGVEGLPKAENC